MLIVDPAKLGLTTTLGYVWDPILLDYVVATPAIGGGGGGGGPVTIANGADLATGSTLDLEAAAGNGSVIALLKRIRTLLGAALTVDLRDGLGNVVNSSNGPQPLMGDPNSRALLVMPHKDAEFVLSPISTIVVAQDPVMDWFTYVRRQSDGLAINPVEKTQLPAALSAAGNLKVSIAEDGGAVIGVDDNGGSLTVDGAVDVTDRPARSLGIIASITAALDIGDRAARILGIVKQGRDQGRVWKSIRFTSAAAAAADTILSATLNTDGVDAGAGATTFAVTAGKKFRVTGVTLSVRTTTAATPWGLLSLRVNPAGAAVIGSPVVHWLAVGGTAAVIGNVASDTLIFPEGWELSGTMQLALTFANNVATNVTNIVVHGYEYTP